MYPTATVITAKNVVQCFSLFFQSLLLHRVASHVTEDITLMDSGKVQLSNIVHVLLNLKTATVMHLDCIKKNNK